MIKAELTDMDAVFNMTWGEFAQREFLPNTPKSVIDSLNHQSRQMRADFKAKFGRDPNPDDKVFFDITPEELAKQFISTLDAMGDDEIRPDIKYATKKTGLMPTDETFRYLSGKDKRRWRAALREYETLGKAK